MSKSTDDADALVREINQLKENLDILGVPLDDRNRWKLRLADYIARKAQEKELRYTKHRQREYGLKLRHEQRLQMLRSQEADQSSGSDLNSSNS